MIPPSLSKVKKAVITLEASLKNGTIYYISLMKDTISTLFVTLSLHCTFATLQLGSRINFSQCLAKRKEPE